MEEVCYSSVFFIKTDSKPKVEQRVEETVYGEVKKKEVETSAATEDQSAFSSHQYRCAVVVLGLLTAVLLSAFVTVLVYHMVNESESKTLLVSQLHHLEDKYTSLLALHKNTSAANQQLHLAMVILQEEKKTLKMERDRLNQSIEVIFQFNSFPVDVYCPVIDQVTQERKCRPCKEGWLYYQSSCYQFIYNSGWEWRTWRDSKNVCTTRESHLVIIDTAEEQAFINNHTRYYYDVHHGYWIGLRKIQSNWQWVNGNELIGGHWRRTGSGDCVASMPSIDPSMSWVNYQCSMRHRWICEMDAVMWPDWPQ